MLFHDMFCLVGLACKKRERVNDVSTVGGGRFSTCLVKTIFNKFDLVYEGVFLYTPNLASVYRGF